MLIVGVEHGPSVQRATQPGVAQDGLSTGSRCARLSDSFGSSRWELNSRKESGYQESKVLHG